MSVDQLIAVLGTVTEDALLAFGRADLALLAKGLDDAAQAVAKAIESHKGPLAIEIAAADAGADAAEDIKFKGE